MTQRAYKYRFHPNKSQAEMLEQTFGCVRFVYNRTLAYSQDQYEQQSHHDDLDNMSLKSPICKM